VRIRAIRGRGLASLSAPFELDLDAEPMRGAGVFVIGGPTGAGKSTILDAMCLALFDRAPRIARAPQRDVIRAGTRTRASAPIGPTASEQEPTVRDASDEAWIRATDPRSIVRRGARHAFAEVDFEGRRGGLFRARWEVRSVKRRGGGHALGKPTMSLLALGKVPARRDDRRDEDSSSASTASEVGRRSPPGELATVAEDPRSAQLEGASRGRVGTTKTDVLAQIEARLGLDFAQFCRSVLLPQGELASFLEAPDDERARLLERVTGTEIYSTLSRVVHARATTLVREARERSVEIDALAVLTDAEREQLARHRDEAAIEAARTNKRLAELVAIERAHETCRILALELVQAERELDEVTRQLGLFEPRREDVARGQRAREVRAEQQAARTAALELGRAERELAGLLEQLDRSVPAVAESEEALERGRAELLALEADSAPLEARLVAHERALAGWSECAGRDEALRPARHRAELAFEGAGRRERDARKTLAAFERELAVVAEVAVVEGELSAEAAERSIEPLAALVRHQLRAGEPCPVCGATEHPRRAGDESAGRAAGRRDDPRAVVEALEARRRRAERCETLRVETSRAQAVLGLRQEETERARQVLVEARLAAEQAYEARSLARAEIEREHGVEPPAQRRAAHARALAAARGHLASLERAHAEQTARIERARVGSESARVRVEHAAGACEAARHALAAALASRGLTADDLTQAERLDERELARWSTEIERLDQRRDRQRAIVGERRRRAEAAQAALPEDLPAPEEIEAARREAERARAGAEQVRVVAETRLADDAARRAERAARWVALGALRDEAATWERLARLVGSADGKKLRLVVQSIALDILLAHANQQLRVLAPRYRLARRTTQPGSLALDVLDAELEGGPRATSSLSGGERFLVSLALALGLGTMTAEHDDVGSLFLDEGFGSLDEESLEQALEALDALRQAGRQIGVVSHVARLAERFDVRVEVRPAEPGASTVHVVTS
jgi:exonuclease SbcC